MTIFRHIGTGKLYCIEHLILDTYHLNRNAFSGYYAIPLYEKAETIYSKSKDLLNQFVAVAYR